MSIKSLKDAGGLALRKEEFTVTFNGQEIKFIATELNTISLGAIAIQHGDGDNHLAHMVSQSISDLEGNRFTYEEVLQLHPDVAKPFVEAASRVNSHAKAAEKN
jgi:hypothetical protein